MSERQLTPGQRAYEEKRAKKAGMTLDRWLDQKEKEAQAARDAAAKAAEVAKAEAEPKPKGFFARLLEKAQKPL